MCTGEIHNQGKTADRFLTEKNTLISCFQNWLTFYFLADLDDSNTILFVLDSTFSLSFQIWKISKIPKTVNILTKTGFLTMWLK